MTESLNLEAMRRDTITKAVKKFVTIEATAKALGVSEKTVIRWKKNYGLSRTNKKRK